MRPEDVPAEWVEVAAEAAWKDGNPHATLDMMPPWMREIGNRRMRAAIAAVASAIALAERERCARGADDEPEPDGPIPDDIARHSKEILVRAAVRATKNNIAAAIRARTGEPT
jgi:hypothetical protein